MKDAFILFYAAIFIALFLAAFVLLAPGLVLVAVVRWAWGWLDALTDCIPHFAVLALLAAPAYGQVPT